MAHKMWLIKADADEEHPETEASPYLASHGMDVEPVYIMPSNPISQIEAQGRIYQVYHVKQDNVNMPVEMALGNFLRNQVVQYDPIQSGITHPPDRVQRSVGWRLPGPQFSWADASIGTAKRVFTTFGENIYNFMNPRKPGSG